MEPYRIGFVLEQVLGHVTHGVNIRQWVQRSLERDYGLPSERIEVIPPGVDLSLWQSDSSRAQQTDGTMRLLFVGGQFQRKGGPALLRAFEALRAQMPQVRWELDLV